MFALTGHQWKIMRNKLTPAFTSGKMKMMFNTMAVVGKELEDVVDSLCDNKTTIDVKDIFSRFTIDIIMSVVFGLDCNSLKIPNTEFRTFGDKFLRTTLSDQIPFILNLFCPLLLR